MKKRVVIDCFPESASLYGRGHAVVAVDVIRASTSILTALSLGRRCFPVPSVEAARAARARLSHPLLAGEIGGQVPEGFEMNNSPAELAARTDTGRPLVLLSSSGTRLISEAGGADAAYIGCLRNLTSLAKHLAARHARVALIGAGSRGEFREEDQLGCAWLARMLLSLGYRPDGFRTEEIIELWPPKKVTPLWRGKSADYLRRTGQIQDLEFTLSHIDDLDIIPVVHNGEVIVIPSGRSEYGILHRPASAVEAGHATFS